VPVFTIQAPDGRKIDIEAADEATALRGAQEWSQANPAKKKDSLTLGIMKGALPAAEKLAPFSPANLIPGFREANERALPRMRARVEERERTEKPNPFAQIGTSIAATAWVPGGPVKAAVPAVQGAAQGYLLSEADTPQGQAVDAVTGGLIGHFGGKAIDAVSDAISPVVAPAVRRLKDAGVSLTPGMVKGGKAMVREDKMMSRPVVGEAIAAGRQRTQATFNTASVDKALAPLGVKVPSVVKPGHDALDFAKTEIGRAYDVVIPKLSVQINGQQFAANIAPVAQNLKAGQQKQLRQIVSNELGAGQLAGDTLKRAQSNIRRLAGKFRRSQDANDQLLGEALSAVDDELTGAMMAQNPQWAPQLQKVNEAYRGYRIVADAAGRADDGLFNTGQLKQSVRRGDFSKSKDQSARGQAFMQEFSNDARSVIPSRTPDSGTAGRMQSINPFAYGRGALDAVGYSADNLYQAFRLAPRPAAAKRIAAGAKRLRGPAGAAAVAAGSQSRD
jgi:hypothetical protein